jgi:hypothetical protein
MRLFSSVAAISNAGDFSGSGFDPSHTDSMTSPVTRLANPRAMVSTSGNSGMPFQCMSDPIRGAEWRHFSCKTGKITGLTGSIAHSQKMKGDPHCPL